MNDYVASRPRRVQERRSHKSRTGLSDRPGRIIASDLKGRDEGRMILLGPLSLVELRSCCSAGEV